MAKQFPATKLNFAVTRLTRTVAKYALATAINLKKEAQSLFLTKYPLNACLFEWVNFEKCVMVALA